MKTSVFLTLVSMILITGSLFLGEQLLREKDVSLIVAYSISKTCSLAAGIFLFWIALVFFWRAVIKNRDRIVD